MAPAEPLPPPLDPAPVASSVSAPLLARVVPWAPEPDPALSLGEKEGLIQRHASSGAASAAAVDPPRRRERLETDPM